MSVRAALLLLGTLSFLCWNPRTATAEPPSPLRVLFVGNSHVSTHDLPRMVALLAGRRGVALDIERLAEPGHSLADHVAGGRLQRALAREWDWVVLQQGPSARPASRAELIRSAEAIAAGLRGRPVRIALMSVWPDERHRDSSLAAEASYREAATAIDACVLPVATAWRHALALEDPPRLYQRDRLHATPAGAVLAALAIVPAFTGDTPPLPTVGTAGDRSAGDAELRMLEAAAARAYREETRRCEGQERPRAP